MTTQENTLGIIEISPAAIASLVSHAVTQTYGVVGMATPSRASEIAATLSRDPNRGVVVQIDDNAIAIDLYVVLEYGVRIASVATSIINTVRYSVEKHCGLPVQRVNVHVQGLRISESAKTRTKT
jgi:uncharacterized alkaline shock family protein YloU